STSEYCSSSGRISSRMCRQLMQQKVQKSSTTILPRRSSRETCLPPVFRQPRPTSSEARTRPARRVVSVIIGLPGVVRRRRTLGELPGGEGSCSCVSPCYRRGLPAAFGHPFQHLVVLLQLGITGAVGFAVHPPHFPGVIAGPLDAGD